MNYPAATGRESSRTGAMHTRFRAHETLNRRPSGAAISPNFTALEGRRYQLSLNRDMPLADFFCAPRRNSRCALGRDEGRGESAAQKHGAVCAARAGAVFTDALITLTIKHEPLRQSSDWKQYLSASRGFKLSN